MKRCRWCHKRKELVQQFAHGKPNGYRPQCVNAECPRLTQESQPVPDDEGTQWLQALDAVRAERSAR